MNKSLIKIALGSISLVISLLFAASTLVALYNILKYESASGDRAYQIGSAIGHIGTSLALIVMFGAASVGLFMLGRKLMRQRDPVSDKAAHSIDSQQQDES